MDGNQNKSPQPIYVKKIQVLSPIDGAKNRCFLTNYEGQKRETKNDIKFRHFTPDHDFGIS